MTSAFTTRALAAGAVIVLMATAPLAAQRQRGPGMPRYDTATETSITGTVTEVQTHQGRMNRTGVHLLLQTATETRDVHLGPTAWLESHHFEFTKGETLTVIGSAVTIDGKPAVLAREIKRGETTMTLRNSHGIPEWARGQGRRRS